MEMLFVELYDIFVFHRYLLFVFLYLFSLGISFLLPKYSIATFFYEVVPVAWKSGAHGMLLQHPRFSYGWRKTNLLSFFHLNLLF